MKYSDKRTSNRCAKCGNYVDKTCKVTGKSTHFNSGCKDDWVVKPEDDK